MEYQIKLMQYERAIGELKALLALFYDPMDSKKEEYERIKELVENLDKELSNYL